MKESIDDVILLGIFMVILAISLSVNTTGNEKPMEVTQDSIFNKWRRIF